MAWNNTAHRLLLLNEVGNEAKEWGWVCGHRNGFPLNVYAAAEGEGATKDWKEEGGGEAKGGLRRRERDGMTNEKGGRIIGGWGKGEGEEEDWRGWKDREEEEDWKEKQWGGKERRVDG